MTNSRDSGTHDPPARPSYRVTVNMPLRDEGRRAGAVVSFIVHVLIVALLGLPFVFSRTIIARIEQGAGGKGPAGGGGGGRGADEGYHETLRFVRVMPGAVRTPTTLPPIPTLVTPKVQPPTPPVVAPQPEPQAKPPEPVATPAAQTLASIAGAGSGSGHDGTTGNGAGTGGGAGAGIGPGRGSGNGPGTGGGTQANYPPFPIEFFLPPLPPPASVRGFHFIAEFDVDSTGRVLDFKFSETRDGDYNRRIAAILRSMRFRPGSRPDGTPLRMKAQVEYGF